ncbi:MAG: SMC-Scp complex subunit ScpB [Paracoccus sp. (in: a-proteobacteria)]|nr:SMC-Scp complex subunit ScpB [Paracoccus sp. (in: a-proteobacteria)]MBA47671.1 SMC-Scp complex subunit ScpB [Paracoccus sp. (in: a-proteobacteria)]MCS5601552.1 SMC-Scp complex subunit ScpB [Paracoccus sp. (in: a-proteobacteria)]HIC64417.1 SMC-Scp complex subunit ScpB [Paracoccus sp. (in: a-proteobacteria)]
MVEAILFAAAGPITVRDLAARLPRGCDPAEAVSALRRRYQGRGVALERIGDGYAFRTAPDLSFLMQTETVEQRRLSRAAVETLAIIAYHQPVTRAEIEEIRGVAVSRGTLDQLIEMEWVRVGRRRMTPGRPATFVVTETFLDHFGLESARDLPGLSELRAAGLLDSRPPREGIATPLAPATEDDNIDRGIPADDLFEDE